MFCGRCILGEKGLVFWYKLNLFVFLENFGTFLTLAVVASRFICIFRRISDYFNFFLFYLIQWYVSWKFHSHFLDFSYRNIFYILNFSPVFVAISGFSDWREPYVSRLSRMSYVDL